ncbi:nuclear transcription factor Y subunit B-9-like isoform X2 [Salvia miltiorrhiza]|uniref:nuclear transcription factor Y subunit B-9-like isoform X2 n=1 Tax=Salvia miltiorrhiza TaxID=226208 RepID=UPI0025AB5FA5|nr:nuclear transcription factor Y subunit B-9-like isoform X2 [Salvia miltiorrhiza]
MERGGSSNSGLPRSEMDGQGRLKRDPDQYMPIATLTRIMRRVLPDHAKVADDAKETIQECVSEFIAFITTQANEGCHREYRRTITPNDVVSAMDALGFRSYVEPLTVFINKHRAQDCYPPRLAIHPPPPPAYVPSPPQQQPPYGGNYLELAQTRDYFMGYRGGEDFDPFN